MSRYAHPDPAVRELLAEAFADGFQHGMRTANTIAALAADEDDRAAADMLI